MQWVSWHENLSATPANFRQFGQQSINQRREHKDIIVYEGQTKAGVTSCLQNQTDFLDYLSCCTFTNSNEQLAHFLSISQFLKIIKNVALSTNFCPINIDFLETLFDHKLQVFQKLVKLTIFVQ